MSSSDNCDWKFEIHKKLVTVFEKDEEALVRVLFYLDEEDRAYRDDDSQIPPAWRTLKSALTSSDAVFVKYAVRLAEDTKRAEKDVAFRQTMSAVYSQMMDACEEPLPDNTFQEFNVARIYDVNVAQNSGSMGLARALSLIPQANQSLITKMITNRQVISSADEVVSVVNKSSGTVAMIALAAVQLGYDVVRNLFRWWNGDITGKRCCKNIIDSTVTIGAGVAGGVAGAALGAFGGPIGAVAGGIGVGIFAAESTNFTVDRLTQFLFGIPKDEALENAYNFIGVKMTAPNNEVNAAFHRLCLIHHPDKGGTNEDFQLLQIYMGIIRVARGEQL